METNDFIDESRLLEALKNKDIRAFAKFYNLYSEDLLILAFTLLGDAGHSIHKVDSFFLELWEHNKFESITTPIHSYLYNEIKKACQPLVFSSN